MLISHPVLMHVCVNATIRDWDKRLLVGRWPSRQGPAERSRCFRDTYYFYTTHYQPTHHQPTHPSTTKWVGKRGKGNSPCKLGNLWGSSKVDRCTLYDSWLGWLCLHEEKLVRGTDNAGGGERLYWTMVTMKVGPGSRYEDHAYGPFAQGAIYGRTTELFVWCPRWDRGSDGNGTLTLQRLSCLFAETSTIWDMIKFLPLVKSWGGSLKFNQIRCRLRQAEWWPRRIIWLYLWSDTTEYGAAEGPRVFVCCRVQAKSDSYVDGHGMIWRFVQDMDPVSNPTVCAQFASTCHDLRHGLFTESMTLPVQSYRYQERLEKHAFSGWTIQKRLCKDQMGPDSPEMELLLSS